MHSSIPAEFCLPTESWQVDAKDPNALTRLLNLPQIKVKSLRYEGDTQRLYVICEHTVHIACCPACQKISSAIHQYQQRQVRDLPWSGRHCLIEFSTRRFWCQHCQCPFREELIWLEKGSRLTERYAQFVFHQCRCTNIFAVHHQQQLGYKTVERLYYQCAKLVTQVATPCLVRKLGIDEFAIKKGHDQFALALSDLERGCIIAVLPDRKKETLMAHFATWTEEQRASIEEVAMDLWEPYAQATEKDLPNARIVADRFHVMKNLNDQVSRTRCDLQRGLPPETRKILKGCRWLLVRNEINLAQEEKDKLTTMFAVAPELRLLHRLKEDFRAVFETQVHRASACDRLRTWIESVESSGLSQLSKFVGTLRHRWEHILNYFPTRLSSGMVEGLNNKVKVIKRCAYGFGNFEHFALRILVECDGT
jgi:transposase